MMTQLECLDALEQRVTGIRRVNCSDPRSREHCGVDNSQGHLKVTLRSFDGHHMKAAVILYEIITEGKNTCTLRLGINLHMSTVVRNSNKLLTITYYFRFYHSTYDLQLYYKFQLLSSYIIMS